MQIAEIMQVVNVGVSTAYPIAQVASLVAVTVVIWRLGYDWRVVLAPLGAALLLTMAFQLLVAKTYGMPLFAFGLRGAFGPGLGLVPPIAMVAIALSRRLKR